MNERVSPYDLDRNFLRTAGPNCNRCLAGRKADVVWGPYGTKVCAFCTEMIDAGRAWEVIEGAVARMATWRAGSRFAPPPSWWGRQNRNYEASGTRPVVRCPPNRS